MKKALSILLSVLVVLSMFGMVAAAEDIPVSEDIVDVKFMVDEQVIYELQVKPGIIFVSRLDALGVPEKESTETTKYTFMYWENEHGNHFTTGNIPAVDENFEGEEIIYKAVFAEEDIVENQSFFKFLQTIFERINMIFEYFAKVFEGVFDF